jgi:hypothetical protein
MRLALKIKAVYVLVKISGQAVDQRCLADQLWTMYDE